MPPEQIATRRNVFAVILRLFRLAVSKGDLQSSPVEGMETPQPVKPRDRWLSDDEIRLIWNNAMQCHKCFGPIVRLLIMTGQRREVVTGLFWEKLSRDEKLWTLPGERTKNGEPNHIPLNELSIAVLDSVADHAQLPNKGRVFPTSTGAKFTAYAKGKTNLDNSFPNKMASLYRHGAYTTCAGLSQRIFSG